MYGTQYGQLQLKMTSLLKTTSKVATSMVDAESSSHNQPAAFHPSDQQQEHSW